MKVGDILPKSIFEPNHTHIVSELDKGLMITVKELTKPSNLHWHNYLEVELILDGYGEQLLNGQKQNLKRGCISIMRLTDYHQFTPNGNLKLINLSLDENLLSEEILTTITTGRQIPFFELEEESFSVLEQLSLLAIKENDSTSPNRKYIKNILECFFLHLFKTADVTANSTSSTSEPSPIRKAVLYLHIHFRENPSLKTMAEISHYNTSHFSTTFHKEIGMTYSDYLTLLKVSYAKELLAYTDLKISNICFECGFSSHANFLRAFKERTGLSPMQFRQTQSKLVSADAAFDNFDDIITED